MTLHKIRERGVLVFAVAVLCAVATVCRGQDIKPEMTRPEPANPPSVQPSSPPPSSPPPSAPAPAPSTPSEPSRNNDNGSRNNDSGSRSSDSSSRRSDGGSRSGDGGGRRGGDDSNRSNRGDGGAVLGENVSRGTTGSAALPRTGQDFNWLAIAAITLMTLGAGFVLFGRRRTASHPTV